MVKDEVMDLLTEYATNERLSRIVEEDEEVQTARIHAQEKYTQLETTLTKEQKELFETFISADSEEVARMEFLTYQQGLKDMFNLIMSLLDKQIKAFFHFMFKHHIRILLQKFTFSLKKITPIKKKKQVLGCIETAICLKKIIFFDAGNAYPYLQQLTFSLKRLYYFLLCHTSNYRFYNI